MDGIASFKQLERNNVVEELTGYIIDKLSNFPSSREFADILLVKKNENQHSSAFCHFMTKACSAKYYFERETSQKGGSTVDIGVYLGSTLIYTIEAKLLPTPPGSRTKPRFEHEYVSGKGGGIQRFKDENHGLDHSNNLIAESGLLAYVMENDFNFWLTKVNHWITEAAWSNSERLTVISLDKIGRLVSTHIRKNGSSIKLDHFWIQLKN
jgi:hypothetical protein